MKNDHWPLKLHHNLIECDDTLRNYVARAICDINNDIPTLKRWKTPNDCCPRHTSLQLPHMHIGSSSIHPSNQLEFPSQPHCDKLIRRRIGTVGHCTLFFAKE